MPFFSASPSNSAAPPLARASDQDKDVLCAAGDVVATFANERLVQSDKISPITKPAYCTSRLRSPEPHSIEPLKRFESADKVDHNELANLHH